MHFFELKQIVCVKKTNLNISLLLNSSIIQKSHLLVYQPYFIYVFMAVVMVFFLFFGAMVVYCASQFRERKANGRPRGWLCFKADDG